MVKPKYNTWIRKNKIILFFLILSFFIIIAFIKINIILRIAAAVLALPFAYIVFILTYTYYQFASFGGNYQSKIHDLLVSHITIKNGKLLDIGTGSASLIIKAAKAFPKLTLTGIDYWSNDWEYSKNLCENNAKIEGVSDRIDFIKVSASHLPFSNNEFDVLVSCLTFHEVRDEQDKFKVLKEAFRVLKPGGEFVFMDLFSDSKLYGDYTAFDNEIKKLGIYSFTFAELNDLIHLPLILNNKKSLGNAVILYGLK